MSSASAWSFTSKATHWPLLSRSDWDGSRTFGAPVVFACDYTAEAQTAMGADGREFVTKQILFTERASIARGDFVLIGVSTNADPIAAGADEVRAVTRYADTFDQRADDYRIAT
jgi:hypothetical protein